MFKIFVSQYMVQKMPGDRDRTLGAVDNDHATVGN